MRISEKLAERSDEIALVIANEVGMPLMLSKGIQVGLPTMTFADNAQRAMDFVWEEEVGNSTLVREPVGVVAAITPWNYPLHQIANKVAASLAAGCTVVLKPSEVAPINAFLFADIVDEVGLPKGVFNMVTGLGPVVGEAIVAHPKTDMVSFTGSTRAGKRVMQLASEMVKRVSLELGGKSANVILEDADLPDAVADGVFKCYLNSGQTCSALTRMVVPRSRLSEVEDLAVASAAGFMPDDPITGSSLLGPLVSATQQQRVRDYITKGVDEGARIITGGVNPPEGLEQGYYVAPTVFSDVRNDMTIAQEEIFGPVLSHHPLRHRRRGDRDRQRLDLRPRWRRVGRQRREGLRGRAQVAHRSGRDQRRRVQHRRALRRLQAVGHRTRTRKVRLRGVPRGEGHPARLSGRKAHGGRYRLGARR